MGDQSPPEERPDRLSWLIRRFIDPDAEIIYVPSAHVLDVAGTEQAHSFDATGATYDHCGGKCAFKSS